MIVFLGVKIFCFLLSFLFASHFFPSNCLNMFKHIRFGIFKNWKNSRAFYPFAHLCTVALCFCCTALASDFPPPWFESGLRLSLRTCIHAFLLAWHHCFGEGHLSRNFQERWNFWDVGIAENIFSTLITWLITWLVWV